MKKIAVVILCLSLFGQSEAQEIMARWSFDNIENHETLESVSGKADVLKGYFDPVEGVVNQAIRLDGFTGYMERERFGSQLPDNYTVNVWLNMEAYPWFRCPVFDLRKGEKDGIVLGLNRRGEITLGMGQPTTWKEMSGPMLPLHEWTMISLAVEHGEEAVVYINGHRAMYMMSPPSLRPTPNSFLTVGRNSFLEEWWDYQYIVKDEYSYLDGSMDELIMYDHAMDQSKMELIYNEYLPLPEVKVDKRILPAGPEGPAEFGAGYTSLSYTRQWDRMWRTGDYPDVLVRFADNNCRLVFWRGTSFVPCWVTENGIWYTNEWTETWGSDVTSCAEPLMDRECRHSHVRIIENTPARVVVHWRYALVDTEYSFVAIDVDGKGEWADEYYIIYPDGIGIRKIDLYYSNPLRKHDWEETIVLLSPGQHPDDVMDDPEITLMNMKGDKHDYSWRNNLPIEMKEPEGANIHITNFKSEYKPFYIVSPEPFESAEGKYDSPFFRSYSAAIASLNYRPEKVPSIYGWWNHWPVTPVPGDGRWVINNDRASHFNLTTFTQWKDYYMDDRVKSRIMLHGMTNKKPSELLPLAKSWLEAPDLLAENGNAYYETAEMAYIIGDLINGFLSAKLKASAGHPAVKPAFVLKDLKIDNPAVMIDGKSLQRGQDFFSGTVKELNGWKTVIWIDADYKKEIDIVIRGDSR